MSYNRHTAPNPDANRYEQVSQRRDLRRHATPAEAILWRLLSRRQVAGLRWRRQYGVGPYILDFYCPSMRLCIELDGEVHNTPTPPSTTSVAPSTSADCTTSKSSTSKTASPSKTPKASCERWRKGPHKRKQEHEKRK